MRWKDSTREHARGVKKGRRLQFLTFVVLEELDRTGQRHSPTYAARSLLQIVMVYNLFQGIPFFHQWSSKYSSCIIYAILTMASSFHSHVRERLPFPQDSDTVLGRR
jgi:hypothetical protein